MKTTMGRARAGAAVAALVLAAAACGGGAEAEAGEQQGPQASVLAPTDVARAESGSLSSGVVLTGNLEPARQAEVRAQVPGLVRGVGVDRGSKVGQGQVLARIEAEGIRSQAAGAQAQVAGAQAGLALARRQMESARTLYEAGAMSEIEFRGAQAQYEAAQAQLSAARAGATGAAEQARRTAITAPIAGEVSVKNVNEGEAVSPGQALFTVVDSRALELRGQVPVEQAAAIRPGQEVEFTLSSQPGRTLRGQVARVDPVADPATRQVGVTLRLPNEDRALIGGLFATGRVITGRTEAATVVPAAAVRGQGAAAYVLVVDGGVVRRRLVTVAARDEAAGRVSVSAGLNGGETVIVAPGEVEDGARVRVAQEK